MAKRTRCIVIPAIKKNAVIPDQLVKRLAGKTLIQRALDTARQVAPGRDILVVTDSDEIRLICERNGAGCEYNPDHTVASLNIVASLRGILEGLALRYERTIIYRAGAPLITAEDIEDAYQRFMEENSDCLVTVKSVKYRLWKEQGNDIDALLFNEEEEQAYVETKALFMLRDRVFSGNGPTRRLRTTPYFLNSRSIEINSYQDWWLCEKLLQSKHIVFVVVGYPAIGMGHIFRALMLAHEIADHRITFLCTRESELAAGNIAARDYRTLVQESDDLALDVLRLRPDLVVNDILNTEAHYVAAIRDAGIPVANFEDEGPGAALADLVVNALYESDRRPDPRFMYGYRNFCLRDEFLQARRNEFRPVPGRALITFGGTDHSDFTRHTLETLLPLCRDRNMAISVVTGPGYAHREALNARIQEIRAAPGNPPVLFTHATNVMSRMMEDVDVAVCSAGRTVYELAHMRIPSMVLAHHAREDMHTFARPRNGFAYLGIMNPFDPVAVEKAFVRLTDTDLRAELYQRMQRFDFTRNKARVIRRLLGLLHREGQRIKT